jgi:hypothetical protein
VFHITPVKRITAGSEVDPYDFLYHTIRLVAKDGTVVEGYVPSVLNRFDCDPIRDEDAIHVDLVRDRCGIAISLSRIDYIECLDDCVID